MGAPPNRMYHSRPLFSKAVMVTVGTALATISPALPGPWSAIALGLGCVLGGGAVIRSPGDAKRAAPQY